MYNYVYANQFMFRFWQYTYEMCCFSGRDLKEVLVLDDDSSTTIAGLIDRYQPHQSILSSVIKHNPEMETVLSEKTVFHKLGHTSKLPFTTPVGKPETIGADRLAICAASVDLFPNQHNLAIGLGTCITYNYINKAHEFLGEASLRV